MHSLFPTEDQNTGLWVGGLLQGILTLSPNSSGSQLYELPGYKGGSIRRAFPLKKSKILVGAYIGTLVPAFFIVAFTAGIDLVHIVICTFLRSPPGGALQLLKRTEEIMEIEFWPVPQVKSSTFTMKAAMKENYKRMRH